MEPLTEYSRPGNPEEFSYPNLYHGLLKNGVDLDDLIFSGEEWHQSER